MITLNDKTFDKAYDHSAIQTRIQEMASLINNKYNGHPLHLICVLNGAFMFFSDLVKLITVNDCILDFISVSSYEDTKSTGNVILNMDIKHNVTNRHVVIIDDILDTGITLKYISNHLNKKNPKTIDIVVLFYKQENNKTDIKPDYCGFTIPPEFIVGYGLDYNGMGRQLKHVYSLSLES